MGLNIKSSHREEKNLQNNLSLVKQSNKSNSPVHSSGRMGLMGFKYISSYKNPSIPTGISMAKRVTKNILVNNGVVEETEPEEAE